VALRLALTRVLRVRLARPGTQPLALNNRQTRNDEPGFTRDSRHATQATLSLGAAAGPPVPGPGVSNLRNFWPITLKGRRGRIGRGRPAGLQQSRGLGPLARGAQAVTPAFGQSYRTVAREFSSFQVKLETSTGPVLFQVGADARCRTGMPPTGRPGRIWKVASWYIPLLDGIYYAAICIYHMVYTIWYMVYTMIYTMVYIIQK
jgi:hypothetical protein